MMGGKRVGNAIGIELNSVFFREPNKSNSIKKTKYKHLILWANESATRSRNSIVELLSSILDRRHEEPYSPLVSENLFT